MCLRPALRPRRARRYQAGTVDRHGPTRIVRRGLSTRGNFGAPSHGISTRCLRFAPWVAPKDARLASGCWPGFARRDWLPVEFLRMVSVMPYITSPFPKLLGANDVPFSVLTAPSLPCASPPLGKEKGVRERKRGQVRFSTGSSSAAFPFFRVREGLWLLGEPSSSIHET